MRKNIKWTKDQLELAVSTSISIAQALIKLGCNEPDGNYSTFHRYIKIFNVSTVHFKGQAHLAGTKRNLPKTPLSEILTSDSLATTSSLKKRLISDGYLDNKCYICGITSWLDKKISLHLDHISGDKFDNRIENLRMLCPNCHSQTNTYCGKNLKIRKPVYCSCGKQISYNSCRCKDCFYLQSQNNARAVWPTDDELLLFVKNEGFEKIGRKLNVSGTAVRKRLKKRFQNLKELLEKQ